MFAAATRRDFLGVLLGGAAGLAWPATVFGRRLAPEGPELLTAEGARDANPATRLSDTLIEISGAGDNVILVAGPDGAAMINGGSPDRSAELLKKVAAETGGKPVQMLFNTDWH